MGLGLQHKTVDELAKDLDLPATQLLGLFNRTIRKILELLNRILESALSSQLAAVDSDKVTAHMLPVAASLNDELNKAEKELKKKQAAELEKLKDDDFSQFAIKGSDEVWSSALKTMDEITKKGGSGSLTIKSGEKRLSLAEGTVGTEKKQKRGGSEGRKSFGKGGGAWKKSGNKKN